jgi:ABC-type multidrug transport system fused ATPase/permease subunit
MAKKKNDKGGGLLLLLFLLLALAIIATPIVMIIGTVISFFSYIKIRSKIRGKYSDFWLSTDGKAGFKSVSEKLVEAIGNIEKAEDTGNKEGLARNKDGSFALRGNRGKEVQGFLHTNLSIKNKYLPIYEGLKSMPQDSWLKFRKTYTRFYSFLFASICWFITAGILISKEFSDFSHGVNAILRFPTDLIKTLFPNQTGVKFENPDSLLQWKVLLISAGVCLVVYLIVLFASRPFAKSVSPMPPEVNMDNLEKY